MATQKDVARLAGVSVSTVSRVLNDSSLVDENTRKAVKCAIKKLNYKPNLVAYGLRAKSSKMIGLLLPELNHPWYAVLAQYMEACCNEKGYSILIGLHRNDPKREKKLIDEFQRRNVDGLILQPVRDELNVASTLWEYTTVPMVLYGHSFSSREMSNIHLDNYRAGEMAAEHLLELGHRRISCTVGPMVQQYLRERLYGFQARLAKEGIVLSSQDVFECDFNYQASAKKNGERAVQALVDERKADEFPTAIWVHSDIVAVSVIRELQKRGFRIPEDISVMGLDDINMTDMIYPSLTTIGQRLSQMAAISVEMAVRAIEQKAQYTTESIKVEPQLVLRESTGVCRA